ncbi:hypothetical protein CMQ_1710 [Grosmannia clavigera kw1407]|uniref:Uncharacterized protein n=1 Tax=Grosmannia clavigera (strain kw1407 / UAMH 11150) TaxID=655863 RepID=F0XDS7_GROCL|nr:uncharacterized protein CMQ_1710 [Grosmannia clavigera kw1407]EFX04782.1 hypothetical protein CMQ_1710 [Grosmannia clavigera kw1407]
MPLTDVGEQMSRRDRRRLTDSRGPENQYVQELTRRERFERRAGHVSIMEQEIDVSVDIGWMDLIENNADFME